MPPSVTLSQPGDDRGNLCRAYFRAVKFRSVKKSRALGVTGYHQQIDFAIPSVTPLINKFACAKNASKVHYEQFSKSSQRLPGDYP